MFVNSSTVLGFCALFAVGISGLIIPQAGQEEAGKATEHAAVERACLDYVEGVYEVKPELIKKSVHPDLKKFGFSRRDDGYRGVPMTYEQLVALAGQWNKDGRVPDDAPKKVEVFDVLDMTASAKLTAHWGIDYFHLVKEDGKWKIYQVLWQSPPPK